MNTNQLNNMVYVITIVPSFGLLLSLNFINSAFSIAVPLIPINTGSSDLDNNIPNFFSCIHHAVHSNQHISDISPYFKHEPTKNEVIDCYNNTINN
jgi:hypothetical protein